MACTFVVKNPKTGKDVESLLYKDLVKYYGVEAEAEVAYRHVLDSPKFKLQFGDFHKNPDNYLLKDEDGRSRLDKYNEPLVEDVVKYHTDWKLSKLKHNTNEFTNTVSPDLGRLQKIIDNLTTRLRNLRRVKKTVHEKNKLRTQIGKLLKMLKEANAVHGYVEYTQKALITVNDMMDQLIESDNSGVPFTAAQLQNMHKILLSYNDVRRIISEAQELEGSDILDIGKLYFLPKTIIKNLKNVQETIDQLENEYKKRSLDYVADKMMGDDWIANTKEWYAREFRETEKGKKKKDESVVEYRKRVQKYVDNKLQNNDLIIKEDAKQHVMSVLAAGVDISYLERWVLNASNTTSPILRALNFFVLNAEDKARLKMVKLTEEGDIIYKLYKKHMNSLGKSEGKLVSFFELIGERAYKEDGSLSTERGTGWIVHRWHSVWQKDLITIKKAIQSLKKKATLDDIGEIDVDLNDNNRKIARIIKTLQKLYGVNKAYDNDISIKTQKDKISSRYRQVFELKRELQKQYKEKNILEELETPSTKQYQRIVVLEKSIWNKHEKIADLYADAQSFEASLKEEFFKFQDIYHIPNNSLINSSKKDLKRLLNSVGIPFDLESSTNNYESPQYRELEKEKKDNPGSPIYNYYKWLQKAIYIRDRNRPEEFRNGFRYDARRKKLWERADDVRNSDSKFSGLWNNWTKSFLKEIFTYVKGKDIESGQQLKATEETTDTRIDYVPIYFTRVLDIQDQSMQIHDNILDGNFVSANYEEKNAILPYIEMLMSLVRNRKLIRTKGFKQVFKDLVGSEYSFIGKSKAKDVDRKSNVAQNAMDLVASRVFGETISEAGLTIPMLGQEISIRQLWSLWLSATSTILLSANWMSTTSNRLLGGTLHLSEAIASEFFTIKSAAQASAAYNIDGANILDDIGRPFPKSKTNLLGLLFDPLNDYSMYNHTYAYNNKMKAILTSSTLHALNNMAEHSMHHTVMLSVLAETKVLNKGGEYIHKSGKGITKKREDAMTLLKAYKTIKAVDGLSSKKLQIDERVFNIEYRVGETYHTAPFFGKLSRTLTVRKSQEESNDHAIIRLTQIIQKINEMEHGAYSLRNAPPGRRYALFQGLETMRKFMPVGFKHRLQGIGWTLYQLFTNFPEFAKTRGNINFFSDSKEQTRHSSRIYDPITNNIKESQYVTTLKYFAFSGYHGFKKLGQLFAKLHDDTYQVKSGILAMSAEEWGNMSKNEKANIIRTFYELALGTILIQTSMLMKDRGDRDDESYYFLAFFMARLSTELRAYINPWEAARLLQSPATTTTFIERIWNLMDQLGDDIWAGEWERYKAGTRKGETKIKKNLHDVVPWAKAINRHKYVEDILNYHYRE